MKWYIYLILTLMAFPIVLATSDEITTYNVNEEVNLSTLCYDVNGNLCTSAARCNVSIYSPQWNILTSETNATFKLRGFFEYAAGNYTQEGDYKVRFSCLFNGLVGNSRSDFRISNNNIQNVSEGFNMLGLVLIPLFAGLMMLLGALYLDKEHQAFKIGLFLGAFVSVFMAAYLAINSTTNSIIQNAVAEFIQDYTWIFIVIGAYFILYLVVSSVKSIQMKKQDKYKYN